MLNKRKYFNKIIKYSSCFITDCCGSFKKTLIAETVFKKSYAFQKLQKSY